MSEQVEVSALPKCDFCKFYDFAVVDAQYDGKTRQGPWGYMCEKHFKSEGLGLGTGVGQRLVVA